MPIQDNGGKDELSVGLLPQARFILTYVNLLASTSLKNPASVSQLINAGCLALCQTILRLAGPDEGEAEFVTKKSEINETFIIRKKI